MRLALEVNWTLATDKHSNRLDPVVFTLLHEIRQGGHLNHAAQAAGVSYRHAWGLLREWEQHFGKALVSARQGRGAHLTPFGESLLEIAHDVEAELAPTLERVALDAAARISEAVDARRHPLNIVSSHGEPVQALREVLQKRHRVRLDITGSEHALVRFRRGEADISGFHLPLGELGRTVGAHLIGLIDGTRDRLWLVEQRTLGLVSRIAQAVRDLGELPGGKLRFINRQPGSGTRLAFDGLLGARGIAPGEISGYAEEEYTHTAVAALVASGGADVGFASSYAAERLGLAFAPLVDERFYLIMSRDADSSLVRAVDSFCTAQAEALSGIVRTDELCPTVATLKRVHRAGFWKG